jgi:hypothetical protein
MQTKTKSKSRQQVTSTASFASGGLGIRTHRFYNTAEIEAFALKPFIANDLAASSHNPLFPVVSPCGGQQQGQKGTSLPRAYVWDCCRLRRFTGWQSTLPRHSASGAGL